MDLPHSQLEHNAALQFCILDPALLENPAVSDSIRSFGAGCFGFCEEALHAVSRRKKDRRIVFISASFEGKNFKMAKKYSNEIVGPGALVHFAAVRTDRFPDLRRPLYNLAMEKVLAVVDGFDEAQTCAIIKQIHNMGGLVVRKLRASTSR